MLSATIDRYGGHVMHYAGDAVLAMFSAVVDALTCATDIQRDLAIRNAELPHQRRVEFRIGVNLGDVIEDRGDIYGDGVNVACRLENFWAGPGDVCVSESVRTACGKGLPFLYEDLGDQVLKNIENPVHAYRVRAEGSFSTKRNPAFKQSVAAPHIRFTRAPDQTVCFWDLDKRSIAVLPFENSSAAKENAAFFASGIHDDVLTQLAKISALKVISRTSVMQYRKGDRNLREIARELRVATILEGTVQRAGGIVRINVKLVDAQLDEHLWAERYERQFTAGKHLCDSERDRDVDCRSLAGEALAQEVARLSELPTQSTRAYDLYQLARITNGVATFGATCH